MNSIGMLKEYSLHASLKARFAQPEDRLEGIVDGFVVDIVRGGLLVEVQTANFSAIKRKLEKLLDIHRVHLVHPIAVEKWILRLAADGSTVLGRRKSPKRGRLSDIFNELVRFPKLVQHPNFSLEVLLIREEVVWREDGRGSWRRKGRSIADRKLLDVMSNFVFSRPDDYRDFLPTDLPRAFTVRELAKLSEQTLRLAGKMAYCLREMGVIEPTGKRGRAMEYHVVPIENKHDSSRI